MKKETENKQGGAKMKKLVAVAVAVCVGVGMTSLTAIAQEGGISVSAPGVTQLPVMEWEKENDKVANERREASKAAKPIVVGLLSALGDLPRSEGHIGLGGELVYEAPGPGAFEAIESFNDKLSEHYFVTGAAITVDPFLNSDYVTVKISINDNSNWFGGSVQNNRYGANAYTLEVKLKVDDIAKMLNSENTTILEAITASIREGNVDLIDASLTDLSWPKPLEMAPDSK